MVEVDHRDRQRPSAPVGQGKRAGELEIELLPVGQACQSIKLGMLPKALEADLTPCAR